MNAEFEEAYRKYHQRIGTCTPTPMLLYYFWQDAQAAQKRKDAEIARSIECNQPSQQPIVSLAGALIAKAIEAQEGEK